MNAQNTRADWLLPPEVLRPTEFGQVDYRIDIYHTGLLFLQLATSKLIRFTQDEIMAGKPRELATTLSSPFNFALEKALAREARGSPDWVSNGTLARFECVGTATSAIGDDVISRF